MSFATVSTQYWKCVLIVSLICSRGFAQDWECEECPPRSLGLYDCDVQVSKPSWGDPTLSLNQWVSMFFVASGIHEKLAVNDPSSDCFFIIDGQFVNQADSLGSLDSLSHDEDVTWMNLPPPGPIDHVDYLVTGSVTGSGGVYSITVTVEAAGTREVVATGTIDYNLAKSGSKNGRYAAEFLVPLMATVRDFEKEKRDEDEGIAISAHLEMTSEKYRVEVNESIDVTIQLTDCDDVPLDGRTIILTAEGGSFSPDSVETDSEGEAVATFTAKSSPGWGLLEGEFKYDYPFGHGTIHAWGEAKVSIAQPPIDVWEVNASFSTTTTEMADTSWSWQLPGGYRFHYDNRYSTSSRGQARLTGLIRNESGNGAFVFSMNEDPLVMHVSGSLSEHANEKKMEYLSGEIPIFGGFLSGELAQGSQIRTDWLNGMLDDGGFYFEYSPSYQYVSVNASGLGNANYDIKVWEDEKWTTDRGTDLPEVGLDVGWTQGESGGYIGLSDSVYSFSYTETITNRRSTSDFGILTEITRQSLSGSIRPFSRMETGIGTIRNHQSKGCSCDIHINAYPNPFNSSTSICFDIPAASRIKLKIYDFLGRELETVVDNHYFPGQYTVIWRPGVLPSGVYFYCLETEKSFQVKKIIHIR